VRPAGQDRLQRLRRVGQGRTNSAQKEFTKTAGLRACDKAHSLPRGLYLHRRAR